ncbi:uncharacterized protein LOC109793294 isoform X1 [Cajanus cajan]|uniref:uncharacterized protein LOC109793294 isoform X1 n=1 Tax=Cajanus cajan TaxID=3821 RepID=UPI00098DCE01|nr:uncharacterized protein LOC109793294 isoform X1 [Cajanus cajan]
MCYFCGLSGHHIQLVEFSNNITCFGHDNFGPHGCNGNFGYSTQCSVCCKPYYVNRDCCGVLCAYSTCIHGSVVISLQITLWFIIVSTKARIY